MKDREFLIWIHQRLVYTHKENRLLDYMHRLRKVIQATPAHQDSSPMLFANSIADIHLPYVTKEEEIEKKNGFGYIAVDCIGKISRIKDDRKEL